MAVNLQAEDVLVRYPTGFTVGPVRFALGPGIYQLTGRNGTGKTTLLRCLCGAQRPTSGQVRVCGADPLTDASARATIGYLPAVPELPNFLRIDEAWELLAALRGRPRWDGRALRSQLGLDGAMRLSSASAGQRCRAELLAALAGDPTVLLLDEPFSHLDPGSTQVLNQLLDGYRATRTVLLISHRPLDLTVEGIVDLPTPTPAPDTRPR